MILQLLSEKDLPKLMFIEELAHITPWPEEVFRRCFQAGYNFLGLENADNLLGFVIYSLQVGECHILNLCVHPDYQRLGYGRQLMVHALATAKQQGAGVAYLEVRRSNSHAIHLYQKMGFSRVGERPNYYASAKGQEDAIVFAKDLAVT